MTAIRKIENNSNKTNWFIRNKHKLLAVSITAFVTISGFATYCFLTDTDRNDKIDKVNIPGRTYDYKSIVATINGKAVTLEEFNFFMNEVRYRGALPPFILRKVISIYNEEDWNTDFAGKKAGDYLREAALNNAFETELLLMEADKKDIKLSQADLKDIDSQIENDQKRAHQDPRFRNPAIQADVHKYYFKYLYGIGTEEAYKTIITNVKRANLVKNEIRKTMTINEKELNNYFIQFRDRYQARYGKKVRFITLPLVDDKGPKLSDSGIAITRKKAQEFLEKAKTTTDFAALAKEFSNGKQVGDLLTIFEWDTRNNELYRKTLDVLKVNYNPGKVISELIETNNEIGVVWFDSETEVEIPSLEKIRGKVVDDFTLQKYNEMIKQWIKDSKIDKKRLYNIAGISRAREL